MKVAIVLPGLRHNPDDVAYQNIISTFTVRGFRAQVHNPDWEKEKASDWVNDLLVDIPSDAELTLFGFSLGAFIAILASEKVEVKNLIACSPSGYFQEYEPLLTKEDLAHAEKTITDFRALSTIKIVPNLKVEHGYILAGSEELKEWADFRQWVSDLEVQTGWFKIVAPGVGHEIEAPSYQEAVIGVINKIT